MCVSVKTPVAEDGKPLQHGGSAVLRGPNNKRKAKQKLDSYNILRIRKKFLTSVTLGHPLLSWFLFVSIVTL